MKTIRRRSFLKRTAVAAAALGFPSFTRAQTLRSTDDVRMAVIGFRGRGGDHLSGLSKVSGVHIAGLCDVDETVLSAERQKWKDRGVEIDAQTDLRKLLENKNIDAVSIATPNHWHSLAAIWAIQAGKDVYCEKPVSHNVSEGRRVIEAARKYGKIVQTGTQSRSSHGIRQAVEWVRAGNLGKILAARGLCYKPRMSIGKVSGPQPIPAGVNYDLWCGPAPIRPLMREKLHYDWHWIWDTGNGDLGNQGIHQMDIARWFLGEMELSPRVLSVGGRFGYIDDGQTANTQIIYHGYEKAPLIFEVRGLPKGKQFQDGKLWSGNMDKFMGAGIGVIVHCEGGHVVVPNYSSATAYDKDGKEIQKWSGADDHYQNFIKAVRSRKHTDLNADILEGHLSSALCHTGNVSYRLGKKSTPGEIRDALKNNSDAQETFGRFADHLAANGVSLDADKAGLGVFLKMDPQTERFVGNDAASAMLTRDYRAPYVVPEKV